MQAPGNNPEPREMNWVDYVDSLRARAWQERAPLKMKRPGRFAAPVADVPAKKDEPQREAPRES